MLARLSGAIAALILPALIVLEGGIVTWWFLRLDRSASRRTFPRFTIATIGAVAAGLIVIPVLFRVLDRPESAGPIRSA